jgi:hypothetical protein
VDVFDVAFEDLVAHRDGLRDPERPPPENVCLHVRVGVGFPVADELPCADEVSDEVDDAEVCSVLVMVEEN